MASTTTHETITQTIKAQLDGFNNLSIDQILATRSADCVYEFLPKSMGMPPMDNAAYKEYFNTTIASTFKNFKFTTDYIVIDVEARKAAVHGLTTADSPIGPFVNECSIFFGLDESGKKITRMQEMVDSAATADAIAKLQELQAASGESKA